jgi:L-aminopeptidase/D-esterase-like protein
LLSGGSAFGLAAADGVMRWLEERDMGFDAGDAFVPIVPAAVLYDLGVGSAQARPGANEGYAACESAEDKPLKQGRFGAGAGATVGKAAGLSFSSPGGFGAASIELPGGVVVAACFAVNALGDIFSHETASASRGCAAARWRTR